MADYIEREAVRDLINEEIASWGSCPDEREALLNLLDRLYGDIPAADVVERKRGEWVYIGGDEWCCSRCGFVASTEGRWEPMMEKFCEECGADMREEEPT